MTSGATAEGRFGKQDFAYLADEDVYRCPAGEKLTYRYSNIENGQPLRRYRTNACGSCVLKTVCTTGKERRFTRAEDERVLKAVQRRLDADPNAMRRRETVEHPFGTIKARMGAAFSRSQVHSLTPSQQTSCFCILRDAIFTQVSAECIAMTIRSRPWNVNYYKCDTLVLLTMLIFVGATTMRWQAKPTGAKPSVAFSNLQAPVTTLRFPPKRSCCNHGASSGADYPATSRTSLRGICRMNQMRSRGITNSAFAL